MNFYRLHTKPEKLFHYSEMAPILKQQEIDDFFKKQQLPEHEGKGEDFIAKDSFLSMQYAKNVIKGEWKKGEPAIARTAEASYYYSAMTLDGKRFPEGEDAIARSVYFSNAYAKVVLKGRFPKGETAIATDGEGSYMYAKNINAPFPKGEEVMKNTSDGWKHGGTYFDLYQKFLADKKVKDDEMKSILDDDPLGLL